MSRAVIVVVFDWPGVGMDENATMNQVANVVIPYIREHINVELHPQAHIAIKESAQAVLDALPSWTPAGYWPGVGVRGHTTEETESEVRHE